MKRGKAQSSENANTTVTMTDEQFRTLLNELRVSPMQSIHEGSPASGEGVLITGNFAKCTSRFDGSETADVEAFIDSVLTYKDCTNITDTNAFRGLSMLLIGTAATWWQGIKTSINDWDDAIKTLREAFSRKLPPPLIYREIFSREQESDESTDMFVCRIRALFAQLTYTLPIKAQIDMIYGLLARKIRKRITRNEINNFSELLLRSRAIEQSLKENNNKHLSENVKNSKRFKERPKCEHCHYFGHLISECRIKAADEKKKHDSKSKNTVNDDNRKIQTSYNEVVKPPIKCYGCGTLGFIRSVCPTCTSTKSSAEQSNSFTFSSVTTSLPNKLNRPMLAVEIEGQTGMACLDTGSQGSIAGTQLHKILKDRGCLARRKLIDMQLADGETRNVNAEIFDVIINVNHRKVPTTLVAIPEYINTKTLLGVDFITSAKIVIDFSQQQWFFADELNKCYPFLVKQENCLKVASCQSNMSVAQRKNEGEHLEELQRIRRFVSDYVAVAKPLSELTKKNVTWTWGPAQEEAFAELKKLLTTSPILRQADHTKPFVLKTDASAYAIGAVLLQGEAQAELPVEYASRLLTASEKNYSTTEREALAVVWAVQKFRGYLEDAEVIVVSDHQPLKWLMSLKSPSGRLARWALALQPYNLRIDYTPRRSNVVADTLSRPPFEEEIQVCSVTVDLPTVPANEIRNKQVSPTTYQVAQVGSPETTAGVYHVSALTPYVPDDNVRMPLRPIRSRGRPHQHRQGTQPLPEKIRRRIHDETLPQSSSVPPEDVSVTLRGRM